MAALLFKVGTLAIKTVAKPLAGRFQSYALSHGRFRDGVIALARRIHRMEVAINRGAEGKQGKAFVGDLTEDKALELASKVVSEGFIFAVGVGIVALEYERQRRKDVVKKAQDEAFKQHIDRHYEDERRLLEEEKRLQTEMLNRLAGRMEQLEQQMQCMQEQQQKQASCSSEKGG
ncbi:hypothetical protein WJX72_001401 [[Myrmecia] bisecta]|uniref:Optic atrophy 3 protein n=1 Tax=[Myrmecia] bisecta TaxID=41462 RepID=A0AAW1QP93_9CHLO